MIIVFTVADNIGMIAKKTYFPYSVIDEWILLIFFLIQLQM